MPTIDPVKNLEYVKKSQSKKKETLGAEAYNKIMADVEQKHRDKLKAKIGQDEYKRHQAKYMKAYRAKQRELKKNIGKNQNQKSINTLTDAIRARKARKELLSLAIERANQPEPKSSIDKTSLYSQMATAGSNLEAIGEKLEQVPKAKRGRKPLKSQ
jgi:tRNA nucleotidyltransferase (CCA-adding enzyme)